jgi:hypothetical protein
LSLTPSKYWRIACESSAAIAQPPELFTLPQSLASQASPPGRGHGLAIAAYDEQASTGMLQWVGIVTGGSGADRTVNWQPTLAEIFIDTPSGKGFWKKGDFGFANSKVADYGLHELWQAHFPELELRDHTPGITRPRSPRVASPRTASGPRQGGVAPERLNPIEVIGTPTSGPRAGVVYVLKSAYGYKVGRTRNVPARMRAFGVVLPFMYTVLMCAWFDDCHEAERRYHLRYADKRINGEWFDLEEADIQAIRLRA